ncbi:MAG: NUDIX hydrolase [bacterium]|nr:NUDIX hydrolase [bacterium]
MKPKRLSRTVIYENPWVNLYIDKVRFPDGRVIEQHHLLDFEQEAVAVLVENAQQHLLFVQAYRYVTDTIEWEIPAGGIEPGESITEAATREVQEETGYAITNCEQTYSYYPMNGMANKVFHIVRGDAGTNSGHFDKNEVKDWTWMSRRDVSRMIHTQHIKDGFTLTAVLLYLMNPDSV